VNRRSVEARVVGTVPAAGRVVDALRSISNKIALLRSAPPAYDPYQVTVEMPPAEHMASAVDMYMEHFETEFTLALEDIARNLGDPWGY
jgi:hypothetical protein